MVDPSDTFYQTLELALDEPVGCLSMSPENRDIVLGARKGLFIIDLHHPYEPPRFLAHSATWDVADIQWSPHPERRSWVASTSSQKALIWNLDLPYHSQLPSSNSSAFGSAVYPHRGVQSPIQFVLEAHTRAICDINWSVFNVDVLATCGIDSWTYAFDLRVGGSAAVQGFCAWTSPATQVKWNRQDPHLLATAHDSRVLVWDTRNPAEPILEIKAHNEKIYGIDWSRRSSDGLVTCSLDKTVMFWSTNCIEKPQKVIQTSSPVRRARHLPFGQGVMILPQRSEHVLKMWSEDQLSAPIATFSGHQETVREFVWRTRGGANPNFDDREFQLVTWGNDRKLRLWPISPETLKKAGFKPGAPIDVRVTRKATSANRSFRQSSLTVPLNPSPSMSISPFRSGRTSHASSYTSSSTAIRNVFQHRSSPRHKVNKSSKEAGSERTRHSHSLTAKDRINRHPGYMTQQPTSGTLNTPSHRLTWMEGVKIHRPAAESSSSNPMRHNLYWRNSNLTRSLSRNRRDEASVDPSLNPLSLEPPTLGEELTAAQRNFPRINFEQIAVQNRTCSVGLYGPWAARGGIAFLRAMFSFPKLYPELRSPSIEIERSSDISSRTRAFLLKSARELMRDHIQNHKPAAFESCLRFLLGDRTALEAGKVERFVDSDDEIRDPVAGIRSSVLQNNISVPSPRQAGASFTPQGHLIVFYCGDFRTVHSPQVTTAFPKRNYKFEAFGSLAVIPTNRATTLEDESESDEALRSPMSRRIRIPSDGVSAGAPPIPAREISTLVTIRLLNMLKPLPIPKLQSGDALAVVDSVLQLTPLNVDPIRHRIWIMVRLFLETFDEFPGRAPTPANTEVLLEILKCLSAIHDLEALGYVACVMELNRRACASKHARFEKDQASLHASNPTDYFNSKGIKLGQESSRTPDTPAVVEPSQSPSRGTWSHFFLSLTQSANLSNATAPALGRVPNVSATQGDSNTAPSPDRAVAMLKQQLAGCQSASSLETSTKRDLKSRSENTADGLQKNLVFTALPSRRAEIVLSKPAASRKRRIQVKEIPLEKNITTSTTKTLNDPLLQAELEGYKHYLCDILMRRGKLIERSMVIKLLRVGNAEEPVDPIFTERAQMLSGLDPQSRVELVVLCQSCGSTLSRNGSSACPQCLRAVTHSSCIICHKPVPKLARDCLKCFHGGHLHCMTQWWRIAHTCPTGCGCECSTTYNQLLNSTATTFVGLPLDLSDAHSFTTVDTNILTLLRSSQATISKI